MTKTGILTVVGALLCAQATSTHAADPKEFSANTRWVLNVDIQAAQASPMVSFLKEKVDAAKRQDAERKLAAIKALFGVDLEKDIEQVVIAGSGNGDMGGVAYIYGNLDAERLTTILSANQTFRATDCDGFKVLSWTDDNDKKVKYGSFIRPGLSLMSDKQGALTEALAVLAGKEPGLAPDSALRAALASVPKQLLTLQALDIPSIVGEQPKAEALKQAQALSLCVSSSQPDALDAKLSVTAATDETALKIQQALMGIQALALLRSSEAPEPATLASMAKISNLGRTVSVTMTLPKSVVEQLVRQREARQAAKAAAAAAAPSAEPVPAAVN